MAAPSPEILEHPRFDEVFRRACRQHGLNDYMAEPVRRLVSGKADPRGFQCCNTGCVPCVKDYLGAAEKVLTGLEKPARRKRRWLLF